MSLTSYSSTGTGAGGCFYYFFVPMLGLVVMILCYFWVMERMFSSKAFIWLCLLLAGRSDFFLSPKSLVDLDRWIYFADYFEAWLRLCEDSYCCYLHTFIKISILILIREHLTLLLHLLNVLLSLLGIQVIRKHSLSILIIIIIILIASARGGSLLLITLWFSELFLFVGLLWDLTLFARLLFLLYWCIYIISIGLPCMYILGEKF